MLWARTICITHIRRLYPYNCVDCTIVIFNKFIHDIYAPLLAFIGKIFEQFLTKRPIFSLSTT
jgi:hypothetical protein